MGDDLNAKLAALERLQEMPQEAQTARAAARHHAATLKRQRRQIKDALASTRELVRAPAHGRSDSDYRRLDSDWRLANTKLLLLIVARQCTR